nr:uncharacterized protein LOC123494938 [Aegilops tauschii subsp. strangulata]
MTTAPARSGMISLVRSAGKPSLVRVPGEINLPSGEAPTSPSLPVPIARSGRLSHVRARAVLVYTAPPAAPLLSAAAPLAGTARLPTSTPLNAALLPAGLARLPRSPLPTTVVAASAMSPSALVVAAHRRPAALPRVDDAHARPPRIPVSAGHARPRSGLQLAAASAARLRSPPLRSFLCPRRPPSAAPLGVATSRGTKMN